MNKIQPLSIPHNKIFIDCVNDIDSDRVKNRYLNDSNQIMNIGKSYSEEAQNKSLHLIERNNVTENISSDEFIRLYKYRLVNNRVGGIYDEILQLPEHNICPFCNQRLVSELDHFLPKSNYPNYSVSHINLVPICKECNHSKLDKEINTQNEVFIHPYFDDVLNQNWLKADLINEEPIGVKFLVNEDVNLDQTTLERIKNQFDLLQLNRLYTSHASSELASLIKSLFRPKFRTINKVRTFLEDNRKDNIHRGINHWKNVLLLELSQTNWFCERFIR